MPDLTSAFRKIDRADAHLTSLKQSILDFLNDNSHLVRFENHNDETRHQEVDWQHYSKDEIERLGLSTVPEFQWINDDEGVVPVVLHEYLDVFLSISAAFEEVSPGWGLTVGDIVHNLRSALDHLVYALSVKYSGEPSARLTRDTEWWRHIGFPVRQRDYWKVDAAGVPEPIAQLRGIEPAFRAAFRNLQPTGMNHERSPLWVLNALWNWDKHRLVPFIATQVRFTGISPLPIGQSQGFAMEVVEAAAPGPAKDGAHLALVKVFPLSTPDYTHRNMEVYMNVGITYRIAFADGPPAHGTTVYDTLIELRDLVRNILNVFRDEFS